VSVRLAHGKADFDAFARAGGATNKMEADPNPFFYSNGNALQRTVDLEALGLAIFAGLAGLAGLLLVGQALSRQVASNAQQHETLRALGLTRRQLVSTEVMAAIPISVVGGLLSVALAIAASPLTPIGLARRAELHPGVAVDLPVLLIGFAAVVVFVLARVALAAWRVTRRLPARSPEPAQAGITRSLARLGVPPPLLTGARRALDPVSKRGSGIGSLLATAIGVIAAVAAMTLSASMSHLVTTPRYLGWQWDAIVGNYSQTEQAAKGRAILAADPDVAAFAGRATGGLMIDGITQSATAFQTAKGDIGPPVLRGRLPSKEDEVALGVETLSRIGKHIGDQVELRNVGAPATAVVVGEVIPPIFGDTGGRLGQGVVLTTDLNTKLGGTAPGASSVSDYVVQFRTGVAPDAALNRLRTLFPGTVLYLAKSYDTEALRPIQNLPLIFVLVLTLLVCAALTHIVMTDTRRRWHETGVLKAIGFTRGQSGRVVVWLALILMAAVLVPAIPLGIGAGRLVWHLWAGSLGTLAPAVVPWWTALVIPLSLILAVVVASAPAWWAARIRPAVALRAE
jgi:ABC-type lipoprotein release transport system permease subunit